MLHNIYVYSISFFLIRLRIYTKSYLKHVLKLVHQYYGVTRKN